MESHKLRGKTVIIKSGTYKGEEFWVEDHLVNLLGIAFPSAKISNPACLQYLSRCKQDNIPSNDGKVVGGKIGDFSHLVHESELGDLVV